jgi:hypothetical protein
LPTEVKVSPAILETYVGTFAGDELTLTFTVENGQLFGQIQNQNQKIPIPAMSETTFFVGANVRLEFVKDAGGAVTHLMFRPLNGQDMKLVKK